MKKADGFTMFETLTSFSLLLIIIFNIIPVLTGIRLSVNDLRMERELITRLHDEFYQQILIRESLSFTEKELQNEAFMFYELEGEWIKGCVKWRNHRNQNKEFCLHAKRE
ncbi:hypothetical protein SAMN05192559_102277 [Halobacillus karajensis]|uniref:Competence protein ComGE n=1 Tax=Halobacillus karajensis TaxID=195088 RepID=A0A024P628_9BACI|nr:hypothetical protein [Halobacillus karajensis]CDQ17986.1 hypothetical protein BN982_00226 [Halobacillus karajensis]CDQ24335.1 hypothetical protein BN983_02609 [Halobacillus karajensis]CDQ29416.1 hypothetical protein BN981_03797 [Halobacillus karajensis]SEH61477.1 hypothetical protein SAMN05192559_102277 [Halobacillus karajensis]